MKSTFAFGETRFQHIVRNLLVTGERLFVEGTHFVDQYIVGDCGSYRIRLQKPQDRLECGAEIAYPPAFPFVGALIIAPPLEYDAYPLGTMGG